MSFEKKAIARDISICLEGGSYCFLVDFTGLKVGETWELRQQLRSLGAQFHVVKNRIVSHVLSEKDFPVESAILRGPTALVAGGDDPAAVAKILKNFRSDKDKLPVKGGVLSMRALSVQEIIHLADLPTLPVLRAQLLALCMTPAQQLLRVSQAPLQGCFNVLKARAKAQESVSAA